MRWVLSISLLVDGVGRWILHVQDVPSLLDVGCTIESKDIDKTHRIVRVKLVASAFEQPGNVLGILLPTSGHMASAVMNPKHSRWHVPSLPKLVDSGHLSDGSSIAHRQCTKCRDVLLEILGVLLHNLRVVECQHVTTDQFPVGGSVIISNKSSLREHGLKSCRFGNIEWQTFSMSPIRDGGGEMVILCEPNVTPCHVLNTCINRWLTPGDKPRLGGGRRYRPRLSCSSRCKTPHRELMATRFTTARDGLLSLLMEINDVPTETFVVTFNGG